MMFLPRPGASTRAVITTIERAIMIVWLTPRMIVRRAIGSWTLVRICRRVDPSDVAASTDVGETPRIPRAVIRIAGGDRVDHRRRSPRRLAPMRKNRVIGAR